MLAQFAPYIEKGDITNLPRYTFYIKISALEPEEPFSGLTLLIPLKKNKQKIEKLVQASRDNYAIVYERLAQEQAKITVNKENLSVGKSTQTKPGIKTTAGLPKKNISIPTPTASGGKKS